MSKKTKIERSNFVGLSLREMEDISRLLGMASVLCPKATDRLRAFTLCLQFDSASKSTKARR